MSARLIPLDVVAATLGLRRSYVRRIAADQGRPPAERHYSQKTHDRFPLFFKDGHAWVTTEQTFNAHMRRRLKTWQPTL